MLKTRVPIVIKGRARGGDGLYRLSSHASPLDRGGTLFMGGLPHNGARRTVIGGDDLPNKAHVRGRSRQRFSDGAKRRPQTSRDEAFYAGG